MHCSSTHRVSLIKKSIFAVAVCSAIAGISPAMAADVDVIIIGSVTDTTCNVKPITMDGVDASTINLGAIKTTDGNSPAVKIKLSPIDCTLTGKDQASISWQSADLGELGLVNAQGTANGVYVQLMPINEDTANHIDENNTSSVKNGSPIKVGSTTVYYKAPPSTPLDKDFRYQLSIQKIPNATVTTGTIRTSASFSVAYQ